ncbi:MAG: hypothetical protein P4L33_15700 [Capsulimonadaceae bacterium]|nr:hypothetical protein [Capsulimonadaceae bacterium]
MGWFTVVLGEIAEASYSSIGDIDLSSASNASATLLKKLLIVKTISQDMGSAQAVAFLGAHDDQLGPFAQQVVDAVNAKSISDAVSGVIVLLGIVGE